MLLIVMGPVALMAPKASAWTDAGDNYPSQWKDLPLGATYDSWGEATRYCTSWVAWALHDRNGFELPFHGHAYQFGDMAKNLGYVVDKNPTVGSVAWWDGSTSLGTYGHVAWVKSTNPVVVEEYNFNTPGGYGERQFASYSVPPTGYIHFKDLSGTSSSGGSTPPPSTTLFHGTPADGMVVQNNDTGSRYVTAGGKLTWYNKGDSGQDSAFIGQMNSKNGTTTPLYMSDGEIAAIETLRSGQPYNPPADNTFAYEYGGDGSQFDFQYRLAWKVESSQELGYLNGLNKAVMMPPGSIWPFAGGPGNLPNIQDGRALQALSIPAVYEIEGQGFYWANNQTVVDCLAGGYKNIGGVASGWQLVAASLIQAFLDAGRNTGQIAQCSFPNNTAFYGPGGVERWYIAGSNPYTRAQYTNPLALNCWLGAVPNQVQISVGGINQPTQVSNRDCRENSYLRDGDTNEVFQWSQGALHYIPDGTTLTCMTRGNGAALINVPGAAVGNNLRGTQAFCSFENKMVQRNSDGLVSQVQNNQQHWVPNPAVRDCLAVRTPYGPPIPVDEGLFNSFADSGISAYCPYETQPGLNFVTEDGSTIMLVAPPIGPGQPARIWHVGSLCSGTAAKFQINRVPVGETAGRQLVGDWFASDSGCAGLPG